MDFKGSSDPEDRRFSVDLAETVSLWRCPANPTTARSFAIAHADLLREHERDFLLANQEFLPEEVSLPLELSEGLTTYARLSPDARPALDAKRSGARSAILRDHSLQLKGCRPDPTAERFPFEYLPFGSGRIERTTVPFGVMTAEGVTREILGHCFARKHSVAFQATPLSVWEYREAGALLGYCLVAGVRGERRIESHLDDPGCTVAELIEAQRRGASEIGRQPVGSEIGLRGINLWAYVEGKSRLLSGMHFAGGFRGILNSNLGNDVVVENGDGRTDLLLCDFDTFCMQNLPADPTQDFLDAFCVETLVEVIIGSLPILQYVEVPRGSSTAERADLLGAVYFPKSSLWRSYHRRFFGAAKARGWRPAAVSDSLERARRTEACADALSIRVLSNYYLEHFSDRVIYFPHN